MNTTQSNNPLKNFFRQVKLYIGLPSGHGYYAPGLIDYTDNHEVGVMAMTGQDELILKNPDALLNGEAVLQVLRSCVPAVKDPKQLLSNDIDALMTAIRYVTFNDKLETIINCPSCRHENNFKIDLEYSLNNMSYLESEYAVTLDSGLSVVVKPYGFQELLKSLHSQFEQSKFTRAIETPGLTDEERSKILNDVFIKISQTTFELTLNSIVKIVNEQAGINVTDRAHIAEFLRNSDRAETEKIQILIKEINNIGIEKKFLAQCEKCDHKWTSEIDFNPVNFS